MNKIIKKSIKAFENFNRRTPRKIRKITVPKAPLIFIGEIPEIIYLSNKEGKKIGYIHKTGKPLPRLYARPGGKFFVIIGGKLRVDNWLRG